jgi:DNA ligase-associated metallophosphoesterase
LTALPLAAKHRPALEDRPSEIWTQIAGVAAACDHAGALYLPDFAMLVVADLHLEKGAAFAARGSMLPPWDTLATLDRLAARIEYWRPRAVVSLGDGFHRENSSGLMPDAFRARLAAMTAALEWIWIAGNHDPAPPQGVGGRAVAELAAGPLVLRHEPATDVEVGEIAGHLHPCARIARRGRSVRRPCFAADANRMILPAFGVYAGGLSLFDPAFAGLFEPESLRVHVLGRGRVFTVGGESLR